MHKHTPNNKQSPFNILFTYVGHSGDNLELKYFTKSKVLLWAHRAYWPYHSQEFDRLHKQWFDDNGLNVISIFAPHRLYGVFIEPVMIDNLKAQFHVKIIDDYIHNTFDKLTLSPDGKFYPTDDNEPNKSKPI